MNIHAEITVAETTAATNWVIPINLQRNKGVFILQDRDPSGSCKMSALHNSAEGIINFDLRDSAKNVLSFLLPQRSSLRERLILPAALIFVD